MPILSVEILQKYFHKIKYVFTHFYYKSCENIPISQKRDDDEGERQVQNPYDSIFGRSVVKKLKDKSISYVERLTFQDFKDDVPWTNTFPDFITDLIIYLTGLNLHEYLHIKHMRDQEERDQEDFRVKIAKKREEVHRERVHEIQENGTNVGMGDEYEMQERNEKIMWEQYHISRMDEADLDLRQINKQLGEKRYGKLMRFFKNVAKNTTDALKDSQIYITQESLLKKIKCHFQGVMRMDFMAGRFFMVMADNMSAKRIYFKDFVERMYGSILSDDIGYQNKWAFQMADIDHNGLLNGPDLLTVQDGIESKIM